MKDWLEAFALSVAPIACLIAFGFGCGWIYAHSVIATECRKLGGFYVGKSTFKCEEIRND